MFSCISVCNINMIVENIEQSRVKVSFDVTAEEFEVALDEAFKIVGPNVEIKGFRKGHVPRKAFETKFGVESLYEEAFNYIFNAKSQEIFADQELASKMCSQMAPSVDTEDITRGEALKVSLSFDVYPEFELPQYKGIEVEKAVYEATEAEINDALVAELKKGATIAAKENQVLNNGDIAVFDFKGSVDGVEFPGGSAENYELTIGSGQFIPGFEEQMIGMKASDVKDVNVVFPETYHAEDLAGKAAVFNVVLHEVKEESLPEMTDDYVKTLSIEGVETVEQLKANKKASLETSKQTTEKDRQIDKIINTVLDNTEVTLPQGLIDERVQQIRSQYTEQAKMYNIPFETFLTFMNVTLEKFEADTLEQGKRQALFSLVLGKLIEVENLTPSKEEIEARAAKDAEGTEMTIDQIIGQKLNAYYNELSYNKAIDFLLTNAVEI